MKVVTIAVMHGDWCIVANLTRMTIIFFLAFVFDMNAKLRKLSIQEKRHLGE